MEVQPFKINVPEAKLQDLKARLERTRWPDEISDSQWDYGTDMA